MVPAKIGSLQDVERNPDNNGYYILSGKQRFELQSNAEPLQLEGYPHEDFFVHENSSGEWVVTEGRSGQIIGKPSQNSDTAIQVVLQILNSRYDSGIFDQKILTAVRRHGLSPRYRVKGAQEIVQSNSPNLPVSVKNEGVQNESLQSTVSAPKTETGADTPASKRFVVDATHDGLFNVKDTGNGYPIAVSTTEKGANQMADEMNARQGTPQEVPANLHTEETEGEANGSTRVSTRPEQASKTAARPIEAVHEGGDSSDSASGVRVRSAEEVRPNEGGGNVGQSREQNRRPDVASGTDLHGAGKQSDGGAGGVVGSPPRQADGTRPSDLGADASGRRPSVRKPSSASEKMEEEKPAVKLYSLDNTPVVKATQGSNFTLTPDIENQLAYRTFSVLSDDLRRAIATLKKIEVATLKSVQRTGGFHSQGLSRARLPPDGRVRQRGEGRDCVESQERSLCYQ